eukprot:765706_1
MASFADLEKCIQANISAQNNDIRTQAENYLKELKKKHQQLADALKTGSRITCLFSILTRLMRRADIKIIHKSKFYLFMKCLSDIIPGILWYMSCSDTNSVHEQASKLRRDILGLLSNEEKKEKEVVNDDTKQVDKDDDDDVDMIQNVNNNNNNNNNN